MAPKKNILCLKEKVNVLKSYDARKRSVREIAKDFRISKTQAADILKKRDDILSQWHSNSVCSSLKRNFLNPERQQLDKFVFEWFVRARNRSVPLSGPIIKAKAKEFAEKLQLLDFHASEGWLEKFRRRHNISYRNISGESADVNPEVIDEFFEKISDTIKDYEDDCIYNADETGLFYKALPTKTFSLRNEKCIGGKLSKERLTVLFCANMAGEKEKPLVIGKYARPRPFKNLQYDQLPTDWKFNKKSWMTSLIMTEWLKMFDRKMGIRQKKVLLFLDNAGSHLKDIILKNVKLGFLPPNTTSVYQPLDQGIIKNFKVNYRILILNHILANMETSNSGGTLAKAINVLDALYFIKGSWDKVSSVTIKNCFKKSGFKERVNRDSNFDLEDDIPLAILARMSRTIQQFGSSNTTVEDFILIDEELNVECNDDSVQSFAGNCSNASDDGEDDEDVVEEVSSIKSFKDVQSSIHNLKLFAVQKNDGEAVEHLENLEIHFETSFNNDYKKQSSITDFFTKQNKI